jgi:hypothetical protein
VSAIFLIVFGSFALFILLALMIRKQSPGAEPPQLEIPTQVCGICQVKFPETEMVARIVGEANYKRYFCDRCVVELYEESRNLHDPRFKESVGESLDPRV